MPWRAEGDSGASAPACDRARDRIDPYLDGELAPEEARAMEIHVADCPDCRAELGTARRLRSAMREGLPILSCPPEVTERVLAIARAEAEEPISAGRRAALRRRPAQAPARHVPALQRVRRWRPLLAAAAAALLLLAVPLLYRAVAPPGPGEPPPVSARAPGPPYSAAEVARAEEETRLVLAYVAAVGLDAGRAVQEEVFTAGIGRPARRIVETLEAAGLGPGTAAAEGGAARERRTQP